MPSLAYYEMMRSKNLKFDLRYRLVMSALAKGIRAAARSFACSRNTVRKWLRRYQEQGLAGLAEPSRAPHRIPRDQPRHNSARGNYRPKSLQVPK